MEHLSEGVVDVEGKPPSSAVAEPLRDGVDV